MPNAGALGSSIMIFVLVKDSGERESIRSVLAEAGYAVLALDSVEAAVALLQNNAACDAMLVSTDVLGNNLDLIDQLIAAKVPAPQFIIYGMDPFAKIVLHCLNRGAVDFLAKPFEPDALVHSIESTVNTSDDEQSARPSRDAIVGTSPVADWLEITASSELE